MRDPVEVILDELAVVDPDKAAYLRWVRPQLGDEALLERARAALTSRLGMDQQLSRGPGETLLEAELGMDPDSPTGQFGVYTDDDAVLSDDES